MITVRALYKISRSGVSFRTIEERLRWKEGRFRDFVKFPVDPDDDLEEQESSLFFTMGRIMRVWEEERARIARTLGGLDPANGSPDPPGSSQQSEAEHSGVSFTAAEGQPDFGDVQIAKSITNSQKLDEASYYYNQEDRAFRRLIKEIDEAIDEMIDLESFDESKIEAIERLYRRVLAAWLERMVGAWLKK